jgi:phosphate transport system permease protein
MDYTRISAVLLLIIEIALLVRIKKNLASFLLLWQAQLFTVALIGIVFYPNFLLNLNPITLSVQVAITFVILLIEALTLILYHYNEKGVVWILKGSTVSLIAAVFLVLIIIGSEGVPGFVDNNPIKMLTTSDFAPYAEPNSISQLNLSARLDPYNFTFSTPSSVLHMAPNDNGSFILTISNNGALSDSYVVTYDNVPGLDVNITSRNPQVPSGGSVNITVHVKSTDIGPYLINFLASDKANITKKITTQVIVSTSGFDFVIANNVITINNQQFSSKSVSLGLKNTGTNSSTYVLRIEAPSGFSPSLGISEWSYTDNSATVSMAAGQLRNITLIPRQLTSSSGTFPFTLTASSLAENQTISTLNLTLVITNNQIISAIRPGSIPLSPGNTTTWNISVYSTGAQKMQFDIPHVPIGLSIQAFVNGTDPVSISNGLVYFNHNDSSNIIQLKVTMTNDTIPNNSSFDVVMMTPGTPLEFGLLGLIAGSAITTIGALIIAVPLALACAVFLSEYCNKRIQRVIKPIMEILAGIPSVIFGLWGALTFGPVLVNTIYPVINDTLGVVFPFFRETQSSSGSLLTASIVLGIMIFPIVMSLSYEAIKAVPFDLKEGSISLGATRWQTVRQIVLRKAKQGILGSIILGTGRALGETMAVLMILGFVSGVPNSIFSSSGTMTSAIATTLTGVFSTTQAREGIFAIALLLFILVLILNAILIMVTKEGFWTGRWTGVLTNKVRTVRNWFSGLKWPKRTKDNGLGSQVADNRFISSKKLERSDKIATICLYSSAAIMLFFVAYIIGDIIVRGGLAFNISYLTETQLHGGFQNSIIGSLMLVGVALLVAVPLTVLAAIYINEYTQPDSLLYRGTYISVSTLSSTPSIVFGAFGFLLFILYLNFGFSLLSAGLTLACMILPILYISNMGALRDVPNSHREASYALGVSKWKTISGIVLPSSFPAITSGVFLGIGRAIGETAAILLTAGFLFDTTTSLVQPVASMPVMIYNMFDSSAGNAASMAQLYAAAFLLIVMVIILNLAGKTISYYYQKKRYGAN